MTTPDDKTLDALISELRTYPGLYGDAGAKSADAIAAQRERIAALEAERDALRKRVRDVEIHADATAACMQIRAERAEAEVATCKVCRAINLAADDMPDEIRRLRERIATLEGDAERFAQFNWRQEVIAFADAMETKLRANDWKSHWSGCTKQYLSMRLTQEREELRRAIADGDADQIIAEAADVANFAMMLADNAKRDDARAALDATDSSLRT